MSQDLAILVGKSFIVSSMQVFLSFSRTLFALQVNILAINSTDSQSRNIQSHILDEKT